MVEGEVAMLLSRARAKNDERGITGMLIRHDGCFLQALEGEDAVIDELYGKIRRDPRHTDVETLQDEAITQRKFSGWTMGFRDVSPGELRKIATLGELAAEEPLLVVVTSDNADEVLSEAATLGA